METKQDPKQIKVRRLQDQLRQQVESGKQPDPKLEEELYRLMKETGFGVEEIELPD